MPPQIQTTAIYTGADALTVEQSVATPIEEQVNGAKNMIYMQSINGDDGTMTLQVSFEVGTDVDLDQVQVQNRLSQATSSLPAAVNQLRPHDAADGGNSTAGLRDDLAASDLGPDLPGQLCRDQYQGRARPHSGNRPGQVLWRLELCDAGVGGARHPGQAAVDRRRHRRRDCGAKRGQSRRHHRRRAGAARPAIHLHGARAGSPDEAPRSSATSSCAPIPTAHWCGLRDVAQIELGAENYNQQAYINGEPAAFVLLYQNPGSNALEAANRAKAQDGGTRQALPARHASSTLVLDTTVPVTEGASEIVKTLLEAIGLVVLVVFIFLQSWRATLIPILTIPVSLVGAFMFFPAVGFSINTLSLLGLVLAVGLVVDDAIVVVEAIEAKIEQGSSRATRRLTRWTRSAARWSGSRWCCPRCSSRRASWRESPARSTANSRSRSRFRLSSRPSTRSL